MTSKRDLHDRVDDLEATDQDTPFWMEQVPPEKRRSRAEAWAYLLEEAKSER